MPFPALSGSAGHFQEKNMKENVVMGEGRVHFFVFHPTIWFLGVCLWNNKRIKGALTQRHQYNVKKLSVILIK